MKAISKFFKVAGSIGLAVGLVTLSTVPTFAVDGEGSSANACTRITTLANTSGATLSTKLAGMDGDFTTRLSAISSRDTTVDTKVAGARTKASTAFEAKITSLQAQSGLTDVQKTAITTYATSMKAAEKTRETAVDAARTTYRTALTQLVKTHQADLTTAATTYQNAVATAFTAAEASCTKDPTTSAATLVTLKAAIKTAKTTFSSTRTDAKITTSIKALITTRDAAIKAANADFLKAATSYSATLTTALGTTTASSNTK